MSQQRSTLQRQTIASILDQTDKPLFPQEILKLAQLSLPQIGIATVFRALKALVEEGMAQSVKIGNDATRYEGARQHHHHFKCIKCGDVFDLYCCPGNLERLLPPNFELHSHDITLFGKCSRCA